MHKPALGPMRAVRTRRVTLAAAASLLVICGGAEAQTSPSVSDSVTIADCLANAGNLEPACVGRVADSCLKSADSTQRMAECETRELRVWETWLSRDYALVMAKLPPTARRQLRAIERDYVADVNRRCGFREAVSGPTFMNAPQEQECRLRSAAMQWLWLKDFKISR